MRPVHDRMQAALALVLMICLHPGNLLAPWKMPQRISSSVTACGGSVCESPPQQAPTGPLIPRVANSFWLAISRPSLSAAIATGAGAALQRGLVSACLYVRSCVRLRGRRGVHVRQMFSTHSYTASPAVINQGGRGHCVVTSFSSFCNSLHTDKTAHEQTEQQHTKAGYRGSP